MSKVNVAGVAMTRFRKPKEQARYEELGAEATRLALKDAGISYDLVEQAYVGYCYGDSTSGQRALYDVGLTGIPIVNVNNNCSTGSTALYLARQAIETGAAQCVLALGFEEMGNGALSAKWNDRTRPLQYHAKVITDKYPDDEGPWAPRMFGAAIREYREKYGLETETLAKISLKARRHAEVNPNAVFRDPLTLEEILDAPLIYEPLTKLMCCPPTSGGAAAILCSEEFARKHNLDTSVQIIAQSMTTDFDGAFDGSQIKMAGFDMAQNGARQVYEKSGYGPEDIDVVELHDCFSANELLSYESLGLAPIGGAEQFINDGDNTYGGKFVVNPSGGLLSKGHPLGATGLAQCAELVWQLRGQAEQRQVENARIALQHNLGLGGACVVTMYKAG